MRVDDSPHFFGEWLKRRRQSLDLTQAELAKRVDCSLFALRKIERRGSN
jgi:transcriptional regulator with XRE-family HTH domain